MKRNMGIQVYCQLGDPGQVIQKQGKREEVKQR